VAGASRAVLPNISPKRISDRYRPGDTRPPTAPFGFRRRATASAGHSASAWAADRMERTCPMTGSLREPHTRAGNPRRISSGRHPRWWRRRPPDIAGAELGAVRPRAGDLPSALPSLASTS